MVKTGDVLMAPDGSKDTVGEEYDLVGTYAILKFVGYFDDPAHAGEKEAMELSILQLNNAKSLKG